MACASFFSSYRNHFIISTLWITQLWNKIVFRFRSKTCCLNMLPSHFFQNVFDCTAPNVFLIENNSLHIGAGSRGLKNCNNKITSVSTINKYRPISKLQFLGKMIERAVFQQIHSLWCKTISLIHFSLDFDHTTILRLHLPKF